MELFCFSLEIVKWFICFANHLHRKVTTDYQSKSFTKNAIIFTFCTIRYSLHIYECRVNTLLKFMGHDSKRESLMWRLPLECWGVPG